MECHEDATLAPLPFGKHAAGSAREVAAAAAGSPTDKLVFEPGSEE